MSYDGKKMDHIFLQGETHQSMMLMFQGVIDYYVQISSICVRFMSEVMVMRGLSGVVASALISHTELGGSSPVRDAPVTQL